MTDLISAAASAQAPLSAADSSATKLADDFDQFLTLLTTQLENQDPLEPMDSSEFTNQLVQFTGVEQQIAMNQNLESLIGLSSLQGDSALLGYLGKELVISSDEAPLTDGEATWLYDLEATAEVTRLTIYDENGLKVGESEGATSAGLHELRWDGRDLRGAQLDDGNYRLQVEAVTRNDVSIASETLIRGVATELDRSTGATRIKLNSLPIDPDTIVAVQAERTAGQTTTD